MEVGDDVAEKVNSAVGLLPISVITNHVTELQWADEEGHESDDDVAEHSRYIDIGNQVVTRLWVTIWLPIDMWLAVLLLRGLGLGSYVGASFQLNTSNYFIVVALLRAATAISIARMLAKILSWEFAVWLLRVSS